MSVLVVIISHASNKDDAYWGNCMTGSQAIKIFPDLNLIANPHLNPKAIYINSEHLNELISQAKQLGYYVHERSEQNLRFPPENE